MFRTLVKAPGQYVLQQLAAEIQAAHPGVLAVNEVETTDGRCIAVYSENEQAVDRDALAILIAGHKPTSELVPLPLDQRIVDLEEGLALLHMEVSLR